MEVKLGGSSERGWGLRRYVGLALIMFGLMVACAGEVPATGVPAAQEPVVVEQSRFSTGVGQDANNAWQFSNEIEIVKERDSLGVKYYPTGGSKACDTAEKRSQVGMCQAAEQAVRVSGGSPGVEEALASLFVISQADMDSICPGGAWACTQDDRPARGDSEAFMMVADSIAGSGDMRWMVGAAMHEYEFWKLTRATYDRGWQSGQVSGVMGGENVAEDQACAVVRTDASIAVEACRAEGDNTVCWGGDVGEFVLAVMDLTKLGILYPECTDTANIWQNSTCVSWAGVWWLDAQVTDWNEIVHTQDEVRAAMTQAQSYLMANPGQLSRLESQIERGEMAGVIGTVGGAVGVGGLSAEEQVMRLMAYQSIMLQANGVAESLQVTGVDQPIGEVCGQ